MILVPEGFCLSHAVRVVEHRTNSHGIVPAAPESSSDARRSISRYQASSIDSWRSPSGRFSSGSTRTLQYINGVTWSPVFDGLRYETHQPVILAHPHHAPLTDAAEHWVRSPQPDAGLPLAIEKPEDEFVDAGHVPHVRTCQRRSLARLMDRAPLIRRCTGPMQDISCTRFVKPKKYASRNVTPRSISLLSIQSRPAACTTGVLPCSQHAAHCVRRSNGTSRLQRPDAYDATTNPRIRASRLSQCVRRSNRLVKNPCEQGTVGRRRGSTGIASSGRTHRVLRCARHRVLVTQCPAFSHEAGETHLADHSHRFTRDGRRLAARDRCAKLFPARRGETVHGRGGC